MILIHLHGHSLAGSVMEILRPFSQNVPKARLLSNGSSVVEGDGADLVFTSTVTSHGTTWTVETRDDGNGFMSRSMSVNTSTATIMDPSVPVPVRREVKRQLYFLLADRMGVHPPWGALTGVRPTVLAMEALDAGMDPSSAARSLHESFGVSISKAALAVQTAQAEAQILSSMPAREEACIYVSVPFCSSRCSYCSFPSSTIDKVRERMPAYVDAVLQEAALVGETLRSENRRASCFYIGGGSPAVLTAELIDRLLRGLRNAIPFTGNPESTFEAGRCDDLDEERLAAIAENAIGRICLNPQSTDPTTLARIGRPDPGDGLAYWVSEVRRVGIPVLNMDLIAGLPGEREESFRRSLEDVLSFTPENVTIHTLARKRGSRLSFEPRLPALGDGISTSMVDFAYERLAMEGYAPYYLYRQKDTVDGLENTGFSLPGTSCRYNVAMMSDRREVFGLGAGASTKRISIGTSRIDRKVNTLDLTGYLEKIERQSPHHMPLKK